MKKVVGIFITMVMVFVFVSMAFASDGIAYNTTGEKAKEMIEEWIKNNMGTEDKNLFMNFSDNGTIIYGYGGLAVEDYRAESGYSEWSIEGFNNWSMKQFDMCEINTWCVGFIDGYAIYRSQAQSETSILGGNENGDFYCADVIFIVYSVFDENGNKNNITEDIITEDIITEEIIVH